MSIPYPVRVENGHVILSDGSIVPPATIRSIIQSIRDKKKAEMYAKKTNTASGKPVREAMRFDESQYDEYGRFKKHFESYSDYVKDSIKNGKPPPKESINQPMTEMMHHPEAYGDRYKAYMDKKTEYDRRVSDHQRAESYGNDYYNKVPYAFDTTPSPFHSVDRRRYFAVSQAYGTNY